MVTALAALSLLAQDNLPKRVDLRQGYEKFGLTVCTQNGPLCWDYTVLGLIEYELARQQGKATRLSAGFLEWAASATDREGSGGSNFGRAHRGLEKYGIAPLALAGDPTPEGRGLTPTAQALRAAQELGNVDLKWFRFWNTAELRPDQLQAMKAEIAAGHPVAVGMRWPNHLAFEPGTFVMKVPARNDLFDGHCVALVGYEDRADLPGGGAFLFRNSWGPGWADGGYALMPYALLNFCINDALSVRLEPPSGSFAGAQVFEAETLGISPKLSFDRRNVVLQSSNRGQSVVVEIPVNRSGRYELGLVLTRTEDSGTFRVEVAGSKTLIDAVGPGVSRSRPISCGTINLKKGSVKVRLTSMGKSSASSGTSILVDQLLLARKN